MELSSRAIALATAALQVAAANRAARAERLPPSLGRNVSPRTGRRRSLTGSRQSKASAKV